MIPDSKLNDRELTFYKGWRQAGFVVKFCLQDDGVYKNAYRIFTKEYNDMQTSDDYNKSLNEFKELLKDFIKEFNFDFDFNKPIATI
jgi:hypothetical protein